MRFDMALSAEGDLILGQQQTDANGFLLYYVDYAGGNEIPKLTTDPSIGTVPVRDINVVYSEASELQLMKSRLTTENPDWYFYPEVGADLTDLIGKPNNMKTAQEGIEMILRALTYDNAFNANDLKVEAVPVGPNQILYDVQLSRRNKLIRYAVTLDLQLGVYNTYEKID